MLYSQNRNRVGNKIRPHCLQFQQLSELPWAYSFQTDTNSLFFFFFPFGSEISSLWLKFLVFPPCFSLILQQHGNALLLDSHAKTVLKSVCREAGEVLPCIGSAVPEPGVQTGGVSTANRWGEWAWAGTHRQHLWKHGNVAGRSLSLRQEKWTTLWACSSSVFPMSYSFSLQRIYPTF